MMTKTRIWAVEIVTRMSPNVGEVGTWLWGHDGGHSPHKTTKKIYRRRSVGWEQALRFICHAFVMQIPPI